jgi:prolyl-tRNA synthetase
MAMIQLYAEFATTQAAMPVVVGRKSKLESFAGANVTYTIEAMMGDKKALQVSCGVFLDASQMRTVHHSTAAAAAAAAAAASAAASCLTC